MSLAPDFVVMDLLHLVLVRDLVKGFTKVQDDHVGLYPR